MKIITKYFMGVIFLTMISFGCTPKNKTNLKYDEVWYIDTSYYVDGGGIADIYGSLNSRNVKDSSYAALQCSDKSLYILLLNAYEPDEFFISI